MVWIVNKIIHPAYNFRSSLRRLRYIRVYPAIGTPLCYFRNRTVSRWMKWSILPQYFCYFKGTNVCVVWEYPRSTPWCSRNGTGRFSKDDATSNKNAKACGKDWTRLPMLNFPLSFAKSVLRSARARSHFRLLVFAQSAYYVLERTPSNLVWCLAVTVLILCSHFPGRILRPWSVLQRVPFLLHELHQRCIKAPSVPGAPRKGLSMYQSDSRRAPGKGAWFTHLSRRQGTCDLQLT